MLTKNFDFQPPQSFYFENRQAPACDFLSAVKLEAQIHTELRQTQTSCRKATIYLSSQTAAAITRHTSHPVYLGCRLSWQDWDYEGGRGKRLVGTAEEVGRESCPTGCGATVLCASRFLFRHTITAGAAGAHLASWEPSWWACPCVWSGQRGSRGCQRRCCSCRNVPSDLWWIDPADWSGSGSKRSWSLEEKNKERRRCTMVFLK